MTEILSDSLDLLRSQSWAALLALYWYMVVFEIPRYGLSFLLAVLFPQKPTKPGCALPDARISVVIAGHNEEGAITRCVDALHEQSLRPDEIVVVSDGSTDRTAAVLGNLLRQGRIQQAHATELRGGKSAGSNLAARLTTGDIVVNVDCDCSFDRHALRNIVAPLTDPNVGVVSGNILVRNANATLITVFQSIEYLISISLGKQASDALGQVSCVSGAFGAFRRTAFEQVGGLDAGGGEDLDITLRLRRDGWEVRFIADAVCYTDVPETLSVLVRQRFRWERDSVRIRYRKNADVMNPFSRRFRPRELLHELEFLLFNVIAAAALPFYMLWLVTEMGHYGLTVLIAAQLGLMLLDMVTFLLAAATAPHGQWLRLTPYLIGYTLFNGFFMRFVRVAAYLQEWVFDASYADTYVPDKVHDERG